MITAQKQSIDFFQAPLAKKSGDKHHWGNLPSSALSLAISQAALQAPGVLVVITTDMLTTHRLQDELSFFLKAHPEIPLLNFPDRETLPYDIFSPHRDIISERLLTLYKLPSLKRGILLVSVATIMHTLLPREFLEGSSFVLNINDQLDVERFRERLSVAGYRHVSQVMEHGEFAVRGSIIDLFPMGSTLPYRIDLFDEEVDSIRTFDPDNQRSIETINHISMLPAHEFPLTKEAISNFRQNWRTQFSGNPTNCPVYQDISDGISSSGIEYYVPLFFDATSTLFDYLAETTLILKTGDLQKAADEFWQEIGERYDQLAHDITRPLLPPKMLFLATNELFQSIGNFPQIQLHAEKIDEGAGKYNFACHTPPDLTIDRNKKRPLEKLETYLEQTENRVLICAETAGRRESLIELFTKQASQSLLTLQQNESWQDFLNQSNPIGITIAPLAESLIVDEAGIAMIAEAQLFGQHVVQHRRRQKEKTIGAAGLIRDLVELDIGAPIVHIEHGVGRYLGLQQLKVGDQDAEYLMIAYADNAKLYVPVSSLHLINRYTGPDMEHAPINKLGSQRWSKAKRQAAERIHDIAAELLELYAQRESKVGFQFAPSSDNYSAFANAFPFEATLDQEKSIADIMQDMTSTKKMDRLICGDVGFGKTEVAMRAAFIAVESGKQVAVLTPTTLLAQQHLQTFIDRFADWPIRIDVLSRFRTGKEQAKIVDQLATGKIDIIIGTHKLLQKNIRFKNLGLVIIDEEHRFGVKQKERMKSIRAEVDILALTATPIPRTLNMALSGVRDLSIISTPPLRRLAIKTFVQEKNRTLIREAILREIMRGGQVYYLYNRVEAIERVALELKEIVPEVKLTVAHGQMREKELEQVMSDFYHLRYNVLVCTTIIESGIDIPTANTIIIERADKFGLAQLHQLRGRVGRSHHQAYAYLTIPPKDLITKDAHKRLDAIASLEELGAGFLLATHDLEIRGAGELLGEDQSGQMQAIGFTLYMELLERAVDSLKSGRMPDLEKPLQETTEIDLRIPALIPENYISDVHTRLMFYKRIANAKDETMLEELKVEMVDRFGLLPDYVKNLFSITELKLKAETLGVQKIEASNKEGMIEFIETPKIDTNKLIRLVQTKPKQYQFAGSNRLRIFFPEEESQQQTSLSKHIENILMELV